MPTFSASRPFRATAAHRHAYETAYETPAPLGSHRQLEPASSPYPHANLREWIPARSDTPQTSRLCAASPPICSRRRRRHSCCGSDASGSTRTRASSAAGGFSASAGRGASAVDACKRRRALPAHRPAPSPVRVPESAARPSRRRCGAGRDACARTEAMGHGDRSRASAGAKQGGR